MDEHVERISAIIRVMKIFHGQNINLTAIDKQIDELEEAIAKEIDDSMAIRFKYRNRRKVKLA